MSADIARTSTRLSDGRELIFFDGSAPWTEGETRTIDDQRGLPPAIGGARMRRDPLTGEWIPMASHRMNRTHLPPRELCPLCPTAPGGEGTEIPTDSYDVVVFENRFPSLDVRETPRPGGAVDGETLWPERPASGHCEVVCFTSDHEASFASLSDHSARTVIEAWADRTAEISQIPSVESVFAFENRGREIGVTLAHPHGQIYGYPYVPPRTLQHVTQAAAHYERTGSDLLGDILVAEVRSGRRVLASGEHWTAFVPAASKWPVEVHLVPHRHILDFAETNEEERSELAAMYPAILRRLDRFFEGQEGEVVQAPYIAGWFAAPFGKHREGVERGALPRFHLQVFSVLRAPGKLKYLAGSESAQGAWISDTTPEMVADRFAQIPDLGPVAEGQV
ncbi:galactose-1-phosphate uridylyltransferase [Ornithinimicrobium sp. Arc0846-15]|nr:galactose-1-phosphate uridylyltransferase [Ornithinimicrobium laminariae]